jgi:DNA-binding CsgD family transcriptional regulator
MIASSSDLRPVIDLALDHVRARLTVDAADVLVTNDAGQLIRTASSGFRNMSMPAEILTLPAETWMLGPPRVRLQLEEMFAAGPSPRRSRFMREGFHAYRCVPLAIQSTVLGAIELFSRSGLDLDREDDEFLQQMAALAAIAIETFQFPAHRKQPAGPERVSASRPDFSRRERQILKLLIDGRTNPEIAGALNLSKHTIKSNVRQMLDKANAANRTELAARAAESRWLDTAD